MDAQIQHYRNKLQYETDAWDLYEALNDNKAVTVIDTRSPEAYQHEHIPVAINLPHRTLSPETTSQLDKTHLYVTYCDGIGCNASTKGALKMAELGFQVKELIGGLDWWRRDGYETAGNQASPGKKLTCGCS